MTTELEDGTVVAPRLTTTGKRKLRMPVGLLIGLGVLVTITLVAFIASFFVVEAADALTANTNKGASPEHWLGTDALGRDRFARALIATRLTLIMTVGATAISVIAGVIIGGGLWLAPRWVREPGLRTLEIVASYPGLILAIIIVTILGPGAVPIVIAIGVANTLTIARLSANLAASIAQQEYVETARLLGVPNRLLLARHVLPNMAEPLLLVSASVFSLSLMEISGLSFLGFGVQVPSYDLGTLLSDALPEIYTRPLAVVAPTLMISLIAFAAMLIGDGLAGIADPRVVTKLRAFTPFIGRGKRAQSDDAFVSVKDLTIRSSQGVTLVDNVSFDIRKGEILGLVGESGSGKSLTAMSVAKLLPEGLELRAEQIGVGELDMLGSPTPAELASTISLIYQDPGTTFSPVVKIGSQLSDVLRQHHGMSRTDALATVTDSLAKVHIVAPERVVKRRPFELSGGMLQRSMIASSLSVQPSLIIADEPTTALDVTVQREILRELKRMSKDQSMSMLFISHDMAVVEALCDRVIVMRDGVIVESVSSADLAAGNVSSPYTRMLLDAVPRVTGRDEK